MPLWQDAPRGAGAGLAGAAIGWADAGCGPHRSTSKNAPRKNRVIEKFRMRFPVGCHVAEDGCRSINRLRASFSLSRHGRASSRPSKSFLPQNLSCHKDVDARHRRQVYAVCAGLTAMAGHDDLHDKSRRADKAGSGFCLFDRLFGGARLCRISHRPGVTICGVIGGNLQPLGGGGALQHDIFGDLPVFFPGLLILRLGSETDVSITPAFCGDHETFILLFRKVPNYDIQIGVRHRLFPQMPIRKFHIAKYAVAKRALQLLRLASVK
jgi:hypothetical protein